MGKLRPQARICRQASSPFMTGMLMSCIIQTDFSKLRAQCQAVTVYHEYEVVAVRNKSAYCQLKSDKCLDSRTQHPRRKPQ